MNITRAVYIGLIYDSWWANDYFYPTSINLMQLSTESHQNWRIFQKSRFFHFFQFLHFFTPIVI